jgi:hypothetical protein
LYTAFYPDALRQDHADETLAVLEWSVAEAVAEHDRTFRQLQRQEHGDTPLSRN